MSTIFWEDDAQYASHMARTTRLWFTAIASTGAIIALMAAVTMPLTATAVTFGGTLITVALVIYGIGYGIAYRHGGVIWAVVPAIILAAIAGLGLLGRIGYQAHARAIDTQVLAESHMNDDGTIFVPPGAGTGGPMARMIAAAATRQNDLLQRYQTDIGTLGVSDMMRADFPESERDCGKYDQLSALATRYRAQGIDLPQLQLDDVKSLDAPDNVRTEIKALFESGSDRREHLIAQSWDIEAASARDLRTMCTVVTTTNWTAAGPNFRFDTVQSLQRYNQAAQSLAEHGTEQQNISYARRQDFETLQNALADRWSDL